LIYTHPAAWSDFNEAMLYNGNMVIVNLLNLFSDKYADHQSNVGRATAI
jgi:hypothetical protein